MSCPLCEKIEKIKNGNDPFLIKEFKNSYLLLGEHQYYAGYSVLVTKNHHVEMADISSPQREEIFQELMLSSKLIQTYFKPKKMNLCSLGNVVPHLHWHLFPRYADDPLFKNPPWLQMHLFDGAKISAESRDETIKNLNLCQFHVKS